MTSQTMTIQTTDKQLISMPGASPTTVRIAGIAAVTGPILMLASTVAFITDGDGINDGRVGGMIGVWSCFAFLIAFVGIYRALEPAAPRAAPIMMVVILIGCAAGVGFNIDAILAAEFGRDVLDTLREDNAGVLFAYLPWGLFFPTGLIGTGILLWRTGVLSRVTGGLLVAGGVLFVSARPARIYPLAILGDFLLVAALLPVGWALLTAHRRPSSARADAFA